MSPVIPPGTVAIGALGRVSKVPRYASTLPPGAVQSSEAGSSGSDQLVPAHMLQVSWAADHRVVDGASMARFSSKWKSYLERPETMLGELR